MCEYEIEKRINAACSERIDALDADAILRKAKMNLEKAAPEKNKRSSIKTFLFSTRRGIAAFTAAVMVLTALCVGLPLGLRLSNNPVVENLTVVSGNVIGAVGMETPLLVKIKYAGKPERKAMSGDVKFTSDNENVATVDKDGVVAANGAGNACILIESIENAAGGNKMSRTVDIPIIILDFVPENAYLNTKVTLPKAVADFDIFVSVKFNGEDVRVAEVDARTGFATGLTAEKVAFNNDDIMSFYPVETGRYIVEYYTVDVSGDKLKSLAFSIWCGESRPVLVNIDDWLIPREWGARVFERDAENPEILYEVSNSIRFPYPEFVDSNYGLPVIVEFRIYAPTNYLRVIDFYDIDKNEGNFFSYNGNIEFTKDGWEFDVTQLQSFGSPEFEFGLFTVLYTARNNLNMPSLHYYPILFSEEYIKPS